jgi:hypothetical protein
VIHALSEIIPSDNFQVLSIHRRGKNEYIVRAQDQEYTYTVWLEINQEYKLLLFDYNPKEEEL